MKNWNYINGAQVGNRDVSPSHLKDIEEQIKNWEKAIETVKGLEKENAKKILADLRKERQQIRDNVGNSDGTEKLFHSLEKDVEKKEEKNDEEIEKVGNRLDWSENLVGKYVWVKDKGDEWKFYVLQDKGDKIYGQDTEGHMGWVSKERITGKVNNSKTGNSDPEEEYWKKQFIEAARKKGWTEKAIQEFIKKIEKEGAKGVMIPVKNSADDDKFAYVMREFDEGKLKTPDGKVVTDPAQAKAIAYSESKKAENGCARARNAMKCGNKEVTLWKGNDSVLIKSDGTVLYLENNSYETDRDKFDSQETAVKEMAKQGYKSK